MLLSPSFPLSAFKLQPRAKGTFSAFAFHPSTQLVYPVVCVLTSTRLSESPRGRQTHPARRAVHLSSRHSLTSSSSSYSSRSQSRSQSCLPRSVRSGRPSGCGGFPRASRYGAHNSWEKCLSPSDVSAECARARAVAPDDGSVSAFLSLFLRSPQKIFTRAQPQAVELRLRLAAQPGFGTCSM